jgi:CRP-like cAMP-binding protein
VGDGRRQILSFHIPGDLPDLLSLHLPVMDHALATICPSRVGFIPHHALRALLQQHPRLTDAFWRDTLIDAAVFREWMVGIGRGTPVAVLPTSSSNSSRRWRPPACLETTPFRSRSRRGNRVMQGLRTEKLIVWQGKNITVTDWEGLKEAGDFDPTYLQIGEAYPPALS